MFAGRHAVVTGGGRGIGAAIARALAAEGARVTLMGRDAATLQASAGAITTEFARCEARAVAADDR
jgi:NAD(P)-dependent dehydrogenase (short-subunit alcohol dehydrogenase family)